MHIQFNRRVSLVLLALIAGVCLVTVLPAEAGPGGIVKAVTKSFWGQVGIGILVMIFLPIIIWYNCTRWRHITRVKRDLQQLASVYPQYRWLDVRDRATAIFTWVWSAWSQQKMSMALHHTTHWYWQNQQLVLDQYEKNGLENVCRLISVKGVTPLYVQHVDDETGNGSRIVVSINATVVDYVKDKQSGKTVQGDEKPGDLETIWTLMWDDGFWKLNLIEDESKEASYFGLPMELPKALTKQETGIQQQTR